MTQLLAVHHVTTIDWLIMHPVTDTVRPLISKIKNWLFCKTFWPLSGHEITVFLVHLCICRRSAMVPCAASLNVLCPYSLPRVIARVECYTAVCDWLALRANWMISMHTRDQSCCQTIMKAGQTDFLVYIDKNVLLLSTSFCWLVTIHKNYQNRCWEYLS